MLYSFQGCKIIRDPGTDPYCFVEFQHHQAASAALTAMNKRWAALEKMKNIQFATISGFSPDIALVPLSGQKICFIHYEIEMTHSFLAGWAHPLPLPLVLSATKPIFYFLPSFWSLPDDWLICWATSYTWHWPMPCCSATLLDSSLQQRHFLLGTITTLPLHLVGLYPN